MPRGDRTGPNGQGPMTGRRMGFCAGNDRPGFTEPGIGFRGGGRFRAPGRGFDRGGFAWRANPQPQFQPQPQVNTESQETEKEQLQEELEAMKQQQKEIEKRLKKLR